MVENRGIWIFANTAPTHRPAGLTSPCFSSAAALLPAAAPAFYRPNPLRLEAPLPRQPSAFEGKPAFSPKPHSPPTGSGLTRAKPDAPPFPSVGRFEALSTPQTHALFPFSPAQGNAAWWPFFMRAPPGSRRRLTPGLLVFVSTPSFSPSCFLF